MEQIGIYKITCKANNKFYIGSSKNIKYRWQVHISELRGNRHHSHYLQNSYNKYGEESLEFTILVELHEYNEELLRMIEYYYIEELQPQFNVASPTVYNNTLEWRKKISDSTKKLYTDFGYVNPRKNVGKKYYVYDIYGNIIHDNITMSEIEELYECSYHTYNNLLRKYNGVCYSNKHNFLISEKHITLDTLVYLYKNTNFNSTCKIYDLNYNSYSRTEYYKKSKPHKGKSIKYKDIYKEIINSDKCYVKKDDKIFTLPFLCHFIQQCISNNS